MATLPLAVVAAALKALTRLRELLSEMAAKMTTRFLPYRKEGEDESSARAPPLEEGLPLRFQTYFSLCADSLAQELSVWTNSIPRLSSVTTVVTKTKRLRTYRSISGIARNAGHTTTETGMRLGIFCLKDKGFFPLKTGGASSVGLGNVRPSRDAQFLLDPRIPGFSRGEYVKW